MRYLGKFLLEQGAITKAQLEEGLRYQRQHNRRIGQLAVERGVLTPEDVAAICREQVDDVRLFGDIAVEEKRLSRRDLDELLFLQKVRYTYLGEALLELGHISEEQYRGLLERYRTLPDNRPARPRFGDAQRAERDVLDVFIRALVRTLGRFAAETTTIGQTGPPFAVAAYPVHALVEGTVRGGRGLVGFVCLSDMLARRLTADHGEHRGVEAFFATVGRYFRALLRADGFAPGPLRIMTEVCLAAPPEECVYVCCQGASGQAGAALWLEEEPDAPRT